MPARPAALAPRPMPPPAPTDPPPVEVAEFIRFCHRRRAVGWPELYDEMCAVVGRREFNGWGHEQFAAHGIAFSLFEMPRLAGWVRTVLAAPSEPLVPEAAPIANA